MTYVQIINAVLRRLRESEVSNYNDTEYSTLLGDFVNEVKREVEDAWNWQTLKTSVDVTTSASTSEYTLTGAGNRYKILNVINVTNDSPMKIAPYGWIKEQQAFGNTDEGSPIYYTLEGIDGSDPKIEVFPTPYATETLRFYMIISQADLAANDTELTVPDYPVLLGTYARALSERGEDGGTQYQEAMMQYHRALADAVGQHARHSPHETVWDVE